MTVLLWILGVLAAFLLLVCLTRVGAQIVLKDGSATVDVRVSVFRIRVYPEKESAGTEKKEKKQQEENKKKQMQMNTTALDIIVGIDLFVRNVEKQFI